MSSRITIRTLALLAVLALATTPILATAPDAPVLDTTVTDGAELPAPELHLEDDAPNQTPAPEQDRTPQIDPSDDLRFEAIRLCNEFLYCPSPDCTCLEVNNQRTCYC